MKKVVFIFARIVADSKVGCFSFAYVVYKILCSKEIKIVFVESIDSFERGGVLHEVAI